MYVIFSDNVHIVGPTLTFTSLYDKNKLCASYLQPKFTKVSTE